MFFLRQKIHFCICVMLFLINFSFANNLDIKIEFTNSTQTKIKIYNVNSKSSNFLEPKEQRTLTFELPPKNQNSLLSLRITPVNNYNINDLQRENSVMFSRLDTHPELTNQEGMRSINFITDSSCNRSGDTNQFEKIFFGILKVGGPSVQIVEHFPSCREYCTIQGSIEVLDYVPYDWSK